MHGLVADRNDSNVALLLLIRLRNFGDCTINYTENLQRQVMASVT